MLNDLTNPAKARMNWKSYDGLKNMIFDTDGYFDGTRLKPLSIETSMLSVGAKSQQFSLKDVEFNWDLNWDQYGTPYFNFYWTAGQLIHFTIDDSP